MTYNRKTLFFFANVANFTEAKNFLHGLSINWRYGLNGVANGRKVAYIEVSPRNAVKYDLDLRLDGLYIAMCSSFAIPEKKEPPFRFEGEQIQIDESRPFVCIGDFYTGGDGAKIAIREIKALIKSGLTIEDACNDWYMENC